MTYKNNVPDRLAKPEQPSNAPAIVGVTNEIDAIRQLARTMTAKALFTLEQICESSTNHAARVTAAKEILDRAWGKSSVERVVKAEDDTRITIRFGDEKPKKLRKPKAPPTPKVSLPEPMPYVAPDDDEFDGQDLHV